MLINIPVKLKHTRLLYNLMLEQLGDIIGRSKQYMYTLEKGNIRLSYEMAAKIARAMGTTPDEIFLKDSLSE